MPRRPPDAREDVWSGHARAWRDPAQVVARWEGAGTVDPLLLRHTVRGRWWETLAAADITLLITREYEHLAIAMSVEDGRPLLSYLPIPHPSGLAVDRDRGIVHLASTRNPNQVYDLLPVSAVLARRDLPAPPPHGNPLLPVRARFLPGCTYIHDLALIGGVLHANAVGRNLVVRLADGEQPADVWWPRCVETEEGPITDRNLIQLNSIAAGKNLAASAFSASSDRVGTRRPGQRNFAVDKRGVIFDGATREPIARGLTRPHSARFHDADMWVDNSGYGEVGRVEAGRFLPVTRLPGWTRGLCFAGTTVFVGTSRVIPRFSAYAPGLNVASSICAIHAIDVASGQVLGSLHWPNGNQIFAIEWLPRSLSAGLPFKFGRRAAARERGLFYAFQVPASTPVAKGE